MGYKQGFYTSEDLTDIAAQTRGLISQYKDEKNYILIEDAVICREELSMSTYQLGEIEGDLFDEKLSAELEYEHKVLELTEKYLAEYAKEPKKVPYAEDKAKRRAKIDSKPEYEAMNKAKSAHRIASVLVLNTLPNIQNAISSRIQWMMKDKNAISQPTGDDKSGRPMAEDPYKSAWGNVPDVGEDDAIDNLDKFID